VNPSPIPRGSYARDAAVAAPSPMGPHGHVSYCASRPVCEHPERIRRCRDVRCLIETRGPFGDEQAANMRVYLAVQRSEHKRLVQTDRRSPTASAPRSTEHRS